MTSNPLPAVLRARLDYAQAATKKFNAIDSRHHQGRMYDTMQAWGAQRTARWSGRGLQVQNLKRSPPNADELAEELVDDPDWFAATHSLEDLGDLVRSSIKAPEGRKLVVSDLSAIESRVLGWLTGCSWINRVFFEGRDTYKAFAESWLHKPYATITKEERTLAKPPFLGFGYGIGGQGLMTYAAGMGVEMDLIQCQTAVQTARKQCWEVPRFWDEIEAAFRYPAQTGHPGTLPHCPWVRTERQGRFLVIHLPSGRPLYYDAAGYDTLLEQLVYLGWNQYTNKWEEITTWGGKLTENVVQAIARDVLWHGMRLYTRAGGNIIFHVHDEAVAEEDEARAEDWLQTLSACLSKVPDWAPGLILGAEGYVATRYRKD